MAIFYAGSNSGEFNLKGNKRVMSYVNVILFVERIELVMEIDLV